MDYITIALLAIGIFLVNVAIGAFVFGFICTEDQDAFDWFLFQVDAKQVNCLKHKNLLSNG